MNALAPSSAIEERPPSPLSATLVFGVLGGPLAWFTQLLTGYALASGPCFTHDVRVLVPADGLSWTLGAIVGVLLICTLVALTALWVSWQTLGRARKRRDAYAARARFVATWGVALGAGFLVATLLTVVGIGVLPRCAG